MVISNPIIDGIHHESCHKLFIINIPRLKVHAVIKGHRCRSYDTVRHKQRHHSIQHSSLNTVSVTKLYAGSVVSLSGSKSVALCRSSSHQRLFWYCEEYFFKKLKFENPLRDPVKLIFETIF